MLDRLRDLGALLVVGKRRASGKPLDIAREILDSIRAHAVPEVLRRDVLELMRFVENHMAAGRNHLAVRVLANRSIGAQQMMIHDDDVRRGSALAHASDEALVVAGTLGSQTR